MGTAVNEVFGGEPTDGTVYDTLQTLHDCTDFDGPNESASFWKTQADDRLLPVFGGWNNDFSMDFTLHTLDLVQAALIHAGTTLANLVITIPKKGAAAADLGYTIVAAYITGITRSGKNPKAAAISFEACSVDGVAYPVIYTP